MDRFALALLDGSNAVLVLILVSLGLAVVFGLMNVINMAHGEFLILGAYVLMTLRTIGVPFWIAFGAAPLILALFGVAVEELLIRRTYHRLIDTILATWGLSLVIRQSLVLIYGPGAHGVVAPDVGTVTLFGSPYPIYRLIIMAISLITIAVTFFVFFRTRFGLAARAVIANRDMAACLGIDIRRLDRITFAFGAGLAGLAGAATAPIISIDPSAGLGWLTPAFLSILVGGLGSLTGPLVGGAAVGGLDSFTAALTSPVWSQFVVFLAAILLIRLLPNGMLGRRRREA
jgi:branched-chain amino acid transport system permease protein/urea transport system permease protein